MRHHSIFMLLLIFSKLILFCLNSSLHPPLHFVHHFVCVYVVNITIETIVRWSDGTITSLIFIFFELLKLLDRDGTVLKAERSGKHSVWFRS